MGAFALLTAALIAFVGVAAAATTVVVTQNSTSWSTMDTRPGGAVRFTEDYGAPAGLGAGSLELATDPLPATAKADYWTFAHAGTPLADVADLTYWTYQAPAVQPPHAAVSYQFQIDADGTLGDGQGFTTIVFEPYQSGIVGAGPVLSGVWQSWDVDSGKFWSSRTVTSGTCALVAGFGGAPFYTLPLLKSMCPDAIVLGVGVNIGSNNPGYTVATDGVRFNETTYNFELGRRPSSKDDCKHGGWMTFNDPSFKNQGQCVSYTNHN